MKMLPLHKKASGRSRVETSFDLYRQNVNVRQKCLELDVIVLNVRGVTGVISAYNDLLLWQILLDIF